MVIWPLNNVPGTRNGSRYKNNQPFWWNIIENCRLHDVQMPHHPKPGVSYFSKNKTKKSREYRHTGKNCGEIGMLIHIYSNTAIKW